MPAEEWAVGKVHLGGVGDFAGIGDPILRESYLTAARELLDKNRDHLLQVALPILFLQRHALELALKDSATAVFLYRVAAGSCTTREPKALRREHGLMRLFRVFDRLLGEDERDHDAMSLIESLAEQYDNFDRPDLKDEHGRREYSPSTRARYRKDALPDVIYLNKRQRDLEDLFTRLFARPRDAEAPFGWITEYEELTHGLDSEEAA